MASAWAASSDVRLVTMAACASCSSLKSAGRSRLTADQADSWEQRFLTRYSSTRRARSDRVTGAASWRFLERRASDPAGATPRAGWPKSSGERCKIWPEAWEYDIPGYWERSSAMAFCRLTVRAAWSCGESSVRVIMFSLVVMQRSLLDGKAQFGRWM